MLNFCKINFDFLKFEGSDRLDLINRLSTNEVNSLEKFKGIKTILTSDKGRIVDIITLYNFGDFVFTLCTFGNGPAVLKHLEKYTIMDDFRPVNMAGTHDAILFFGEKVSDFSKEVFNTDISGFENNDFAVCTEDNNDAIAARNDDTFGGFLFMYAIEGKERWDRIIFNSTVRNKFSLNEISPDDYEIRRIELGIPALGKEMGELTNPLECGLGRYVSFTKGCYIGQEVIARLDAYDKINKHMVRIKSKEAIPTAEKPGDIKIFFNDNQCGFVTSSCYSEKSGHIGLGFVKTNLLDLKKDYKIISGDKVIKCNIAELPFE